jgi:hypothetical protein
LATRNRQIKSPFVHGHRGARSRPRPRSDPFSPQPTPRSRSPKGSKQKDQAVAIEPQIQPADGACGAPIQPVGQAQDGCQLDDSLAALRRQRGKALVPNPGPRAAMMASHVGDDSLLILFQAGQLGFHARAVGGLVVIPGTLNVSNIVQYPRAEQNYTMAFLQIV